jgi:hypothetical protein
MSEIVFTYSNGYRTQYLSIIDEASLFLGILAPDLNRFCNKSDGYSDGKITQDTNYRIYLTAKIEIV